MSLLGKMFDADAIKDTLEDKVKEGVADALKDKLEDNEWMELLSKVAEMNKNGKSAAEIAKVMMKDKELIEAALEVVKSNPKLDAGAVAELLKKIK